MLFTVVDRDTKYKSKNFIDTVVYRGSDVTARWIFKGFMTAGLSIPQIVWLYLPVLGLWSWGAWRLGRSYERLIDQSSTAGEDEVAVPVSAEKKPVSLDVGG
jgi:AAA family ATP:ADP antiporter